MSTFLYKNKLRQDLFQQRIRLEDLEPLDFVFLTGGDLPSHPTQNPEECIKNIYIHLHQEDKGKEKESNTWCRKQLPAVESGLT